MLILAVDDEKLELEALMSILVKAEPKSEIRGFRRAEDTIAFAEDKRPDVVFLDIEMKKMNGVDLGQRLMELHPDINLIFTTGYSRYALKAFDIAASGYILKPVTLDKVKREMEHLRFAVHEEKRLYVRAFGDFEVYLDGKPLKFRYQKTKELFAYLVDRKGAICKNDEIMEALWEGTEGENNHISYLKNLRTDLISTLSEHGLNGCLCRMYGGIGVVRENIQCDYYDYLDHQGTEGVKKLFKGEYMSQYSWGEYTLASLEFNEDGES